MAALLGCASLSSGCSTIATELDVSCSTDADCNALNLKAGLGENTCEYYQCIEPSRGCEKLPRDDDEDGYLDGATCAGWRAPEELDCDDRKDEGKARRPHEMESCDGIDNNCDGVIDEGQWGNAALESVDLSIPIEWLSTGEPSDESLPVVTTTKDVVSNALSDLYLFSEDGHRSLRIQKETSHCTKSAELNGGRCTIHQPAIALTSDAWVAMGIDVAGCAAGDVRFASSALNEASPPAWDGDGTNTSNLRLGVPTCAGAGARAPSLAVSREIRGATTDVLALWRASPANTRDPVPGPLLGLGLGITRNAGMLSVRALSDDPPAPLHEGAQGLDPAAVLPWQGGFLVAHDVPDGLELAYVKQLEGGVGPAFAAASRLPFARAGARHVALSIGRATRADERDAIAVAWRVDGTRGSALYFATVSPTSPERLASQGAPSPLTLASEAAISEGPALAHAAGGFAIDEDRNERGGWFVLWIEKSAAGQTLKAARVRADGRGLLDDPRDLQHDGASMEHLFAHAFKNDVRYGFVSGTGATGATQQLNVGSLLCPSPP